jgi:hypothetical protein
MKKIVCVVLVLVVLIAALSGCMPIFHSSTTGRVIYGLNGISLDETLTAEEVRAVKWILNGKIPEPLLVGGYACGFNEDVAFVIGDTTYYLAQDDCNYVQDASTGRYIKISKKGRKVLDDIFRAHGANWK